jgi:hypothetical protein
MVRSSRVDKAMQLLAVNNLLKVAGKEVILHVQQGQQRKVAMLRTLRMVIGLTTRLNVSSKSTPCCWEFPRTTQCALWLARVPSKSVLTLKNRFPVKTLVR